MKTPCPCGRGIVSLWDGKCGHCRTKKEAEALYEAQKNVFRPNNLIIAGSRDFNDYALMLDRVQALEELKLIHQETVLLCGMARGADLMGLRIWKNAKLNYREMPAEWELLGKRAGFARNEAMGAMADLALCFWDGVSKGTEHMIKTMERLNKPVYVVRF